MAFLQFFSPISRNSRSFFAIFIKFSRLLRHAETAGFLVFQTHRFRWTGNLEGSFFLFLCSQSGSVIGYLRGTFAKFSLFRKIFLTHLLF